MKAINENNAEWSQTYITEVCDLFLSEYEYLHLEKQDNLTDKWLDQYSGIDILIKKGNALYGVASRIQKGNWASFTIRSKTYYGNDTELKKRKESINNGSIYPYYTIHAYYKKNIDESGLVTYTYTNGAIIETKELYEFMKYNSNKINKSTNKGDDNDFIYINFEDLIWCESFKQIKTY